MSKDTIFYLLWYNAIRWSIHIYKERSFLSVHSLLFLVTLHKKWRFSLRISSVNVTKSTGNFFVQCKYHRGAQRVKLTKCDLMNGMKNTVMQVTYSLNGSIISLLFPVIILHWEKLTSYNKFSHSLPLKVQIEKFQRFNAINGSIKMLKYRRNFQKFQLKSNILKRFFRYKQWAASRKLFSPIPPTRLKFRTEKNFLTEIYRNVQTFAFQVLRECSSWASRNGTVQMFFLTSTRNMFAGKFVKWVGFWLCCKSIVF